MDWFEKWFDSPFYKILYQNRDEREAQEFVETLLAHLQPPAGSRMLDIACGEGRFARQLAEHGYDVTGIDISHASIENAIASEQDNLHFYVQDMRFPFYINYFDFAFNFFTSFGYFRYQRDHQMAARSFAASLKPGGTLVVDYLNLEQVLSQLVPEDVVHRGSYTFHISRRYEHKHIIKDIQFKDADNRQRHFTESVAGFTLEDFTTMFGHAGMTLEAAYGDYKLSAYDALTSPRMIMIFKKK